MRTKTQDAKDRRKLLEREKALLHPHLAKLISFLMGNRSFEIEHIDRDRSFRMVCDTDVDVEGLSDELAKLLGAVVTTTSEIRGEGCCEFCYSEGYKAVFYVSSITKNWPAEELAALAPKRKTT